MEDKLLEEFVTNTEMHRNAIDHAYDKGAKKQVTEIMGHSEFWAWLADIIYEEKFRTKPTKINYIDKETGEYITYNTAMDLMERGKKVREIYCMEQLDKIVWNMIYQIAYKHYSDWIHEDCVSYKKGECATKTVQELSQYLGSHRCPVIQGDLSKYFDSVPLKLIEKWLKKMSRVYPSKLWTVIWDFYHDNRVIINGKQVERYGSLKQGCAFGCLLADLVLYEADEEMKKYDVYYKRYSDDFIIAGPDAQRAFRAYKKKLRELGVSLNNDKTEMHHSGEWIKFLGFRIKGHIISFTKKSLRKIMLKVKDETVYKSNQLKRALTDSEIEKAIDNIQYYFFEGCPSHPNGMLTYQFAAINDGHDIRELDKMIRNDIMGAWMNRTRTYKCSISERGNHGLHDGYYGKNVGRNLLIAKDIPHECGWYSLMHMYKMCKQGKHLYRMEINRMRNGELASI